MTKKQLRKIANEIVELELIHRNPESPEEEVSRAEKRIIQITNLIYAMPNGMAILDELDDIIQKRLSSQ